ncbi:hypothetical protein [Algibacter luteus]|uniref:hypothetical protein n=1 Tax=Algibacter luteus TaxID=1178825 RepID=UPI002596C11A|nr:hypothetical protein [Algibacter luteus]WJJ97596.1 hypothetical protein O5O44_04245 [Algibacter luteus]
MNKLLVILVVCLGLKGMSQSSYDNNGRIDNIGVNDFGNGMWVKSVSQKVDLKGSPYLYDSWFNNGKIYLSNRVLSIMSMNYNMQLERFEAKISEDSVFAIDPQGIKKVVIRDKEFIRRLDPEFQRNSYFQKIATINGKVLLEKHTVELKEGQINPMTMQKLQKDALIKKEVYYIANSKGEDLKSFKVKKRSILSLINKNKLDRVKTFAKQHKLKFKKAEDVKAIIEYSKTL